mmetsp:Transcript_47518/g.119766  ORF Transcript_47518/g.119766 Transcript_47518/m.119766 type:complete len:502 (-) Transcript_47518:525-2030(-)
MAGGGDMSTDQQMLAVAAYLVCAAIFTVLMGYSTFRSMEPLSKIQIAPLRTRLHWCIKSNIYICFMSAVLHVLHVTNFEYMISASLGPHVLVIKPVEYLLTCPVMMLTLVVLGGERVPRQRQHECSCLTALVLLSGFFASMSLTLPLKLMFFLVGVGFFLILLQRIAVSVKEHSEGKETLFGGWKGSVYKHFCLKIVSTWILFPAWWLVSKEGLGIVESPEINILVTAALNIFAKGVYVIYLQLIHDRYVAESTLMVHPHPKPPEERFAHYAAARLGPAGAIAALEASIANDQRSLDIIKGLTGVVEKGSLTPHDQSVLDTAPGGTSRQLPNGTDDGDLDSMQKWEQLSAWVEQVLQEYGSDDAVMNEFLDKLWHEDVRSMQVLEHFTTADYEALGASVGLRKQLQNAVGKLAARGGSADWRQAQDLTQPPRRSSSRNSSRRSLSRTSSGNSSSVSSPRRMLQPPVAPVGPPQPIVEPVDYAEPVSPRLDPLRPPSPFSRV